MKRLPTLPFVLVAVWIAGAACNGDSPTGLKSNDLQGTWSGALDSVNVMGRTLSGDVDWTFRRSDFTMVFFNPPEGQAERIDGDWDFVDGKMVVTLTSSFPIGTDIGATDTLFVSILNDELSIASNTVQTPILLRNTRLGQRLDPESPYALRRRLATVIPLRDPHPEAPATSADHIRYIYPPV